jgi:hypothetical protein
MDMHHHSLNETESFDRSRMLVGSRGYVIVKQIVKLNFDIRISRSPAA